MICLAGVGGRLHTWECETLGWLLGRQTSAVLGTRSGFWVEIIGHRYCWILSRYRLWRHPLLTVRSGQWLLDIILAVRPPRSLDRRCVPGAFRPSGFMTRAGGLGDRYALSSCSCRKVALGAGAWLDLLWFPSSWAALPLWCRVLDHSSPSP